MWEHNHELIQRLTAIFFLSCDIRKEKEIFFSSPPGFDSWSPGTKSQCAYTLGISNGQKKVELFALHVVWISKGI